MAGLAVAYSRGLFRSRLHHAAAVLLVIGGLFATSSRGAWLAFIAGLLFIQFYRGKAGRVVAIVGLCAAAYGGAKLVGSMDMRLGELLGVAGNPMGTVDYRKDLLYNGIRQIVKRPLFGFDRPSLGVLLGNMVQGEGIIDFVNTYLAVTLSAGLVGLAFFLSNFVALGVWLGGARARLSRIRELREPTAFVVAMAGGLGAALVVQSLSERNPYWLILLFALGRGLQQALEHSRKVPPAAAEGAVRVKAKAVSA
jgi:O-antigen ligase